MSNEETRDSVEFIAFLLWYSFLVFCCVLPTCCAYRRRQMLMQLQREEAEFEQRYFFGGGQFGVAGGSNDANHHGSNGMDDEEARAERTRRITAVLKATSFVSYQKCKSIFYATESETVRLTMLIIDCGRSWKKRTYYCKTRKNVVEKKML